MPLDTSLQRLLYGSPLLRRNGKFALITGLVALFLFALPQFHRYYLTHPVAMMVGILAAVVIYCPTLLALHFFDRREREPGWLFWGTVGSVILYFGPVTARTLRVLENATTLSQWQFVGFVEEFWKVVPLLLLLVFARPAVNGVRDGLIYGALGGLGFALLESGAYFSLVDFPKDGWGGLWANLVGRATLLGTDNHVLFSATVGAAIGYGVSTQNRWFRYLVPIVGYLLVALLHGQQDYIVGKALNLTGVILGASLIQVLAGLPSLEAIDGTPWHYLALIIGSTVGLVGINILTIPTLFWSLWRSGDAERQVVRSQLADEPPSVITSQEYAWAVAEKRLQMRSLPNYPTTLGQTIVQRQNELAFRKAYVQRQGGDIESDRPVIVLRNEIAQLRHASPAISATQKSIL